MLRSPTLVLLFACLCIVSSPFAWANADSLQISVNTTRIVSHEWLMLSWSGVPEEHRADCWLGVFAPATANVTAIPKVHWTGTPPWTASAPIKYLTCADADSNFMTTGAGNRTLTLVNMRDSVAVWLFYGGYEVPSAQVKSQTITFQDIGQPLQGHIARTSSIDEMRVAWNTMSSDPGQIKWGYTSGEYTYSADATVSTYTADQLCGGPANGQGWRDPGYFQNAIMTGLKPGTRVYYVFGSSAQWSTERSFVSAVPPSPHAPINIAITADMGVTEVDGWHYHWMEPDAYQTMEHLKAAAADSQVLLHVGDISYATGYEYKWSLFMNAIDPIASTLPYMTGQGNHERDWPNSGSYYQGYDSGGECGVPTRARFVMPADNADDGWYSFDQASVHFIVMNTEMDYSAASKQYAFIEADLSAVNRSVTPWIIFSGHRPMYAADSRNTGLAVLEPLFMKYKVDLVHWGHIHYATVTCPVYQGKCVTDKQPDLYDAPVHTVIGNGGQGLTSPPSHEAVWTRYQKSEWGYERVLVHNATHLTMQFFANTNNDLHYSFDIVRKFPRVA